MVELARDIRPIRGETVPAGTRGTIKPLQGSTFGSYRFRPSDPRLPMLILGLEDVRKVANEELLEQGWNGGVPSRPYLHRALVARGAAQLAAEDEGPDVRALTEEETKRWRSLAKPVVWPCSINSPLTGPLMPLSERGPLPSDQAALIDAAPDWVRDTNQYMDDRRAAQALELEELPGQQWSETLHPDEVRGLAYLGAALLVGALGWWVMKSVVLPWVIG